MSLSSRKIFFQDLDGFFSSRIFFLNIEGKDTVAKVKTDFGLRTRHPKAALRLSLPGGHGLVLNDKKTVDQCRIEDGDLLLLNCPGNNEELRLRCSAVRRLKQGERK